MKKVIKAILLCTLLAVKGFAQTTIKLGTNNIEVKGTKVSSIAMIPSKTEEDNRVKEKAYYYDGDQIEITLYTQTSNNVNDISVYTYEKGIKLQASLRVYKSKSYKAGKAYVVTLNCNKKICANLTYYDSFTKGVANVLKDQLASITFATKVAADAFIDGINNRR